MSRKHYQALANRISEEVEKLKQRGIHPGRNPAAFLHLKKAAEIFADVALEDNMRFDYRRFMEACNLPDISEEQALVDLQKNVMAEA